MHQRTKNFVKIFLIVLFMYFVIVLIGAAIISAIESWSFLDGFYFSSMVATSIGLGDITPITDSGRLFVSFYALLEVGIFFFLFATVAADVR